MNEPGKSVIAKKESAAQIVDGHLLRTAIGASLMSVAYLMSVAMQLIDSQAVVAIIDRSQLVVGVLVVLVVFPAFLKYSRLRYRQPGECQEIDSYLAEMFRRASATAFGLSFIFMIVLEKVSEKHLLDLPANFFIDIVLTFSLGTLAIAFFRLIHGDGDDESDDDFDAEPGA